MIDSHFNKRSTMALLDKLKDELDKAGRAAQSALDEGKIRLEAFRTRQLADKAAQALGYAVFRSSQTGGTIDADTNTRLSATLATHDAQAAKYEAELEELKKQNRNWGGTGTASSTESTSGSAGSAASSESTPYADGPGSDPAAAPDITG